MSGAWILCGAACLALAAGCSKSATSADAGGQGSSAVSAEPEWAKEHAPPPSDALAFRIQPIPDGDEPSASSEQTAPIVKPIPDDGK